MFKQQIDKDLWMNKECLQSFELPEATLHLSTSNDE